MKKLTLEERINNLENRITKFESALVRERELANIKIVNEDQDNTNPVTHKVLKRFYGALMDDADPAGLDSVIKACLKDKSYNKEMMLLLIMLKAITMYRADKPDKL